MQACSSARISPGVACQPLRRRSTAACRGARLTVQAGLTTEKENPFADELKATAKYISQRGRGILASDESNATTGAAGAWRFWVRWRGRMPVRGMAAICTIAAAARASGQPCLAPLCLKFPYCIHLHPPALTSTHLLQATHGQHGCREQHTSKWPPFALLTLADSPQLHLFNRQAPGQRGC